MSTSAPVILIVDDDEDDHTLLRLAIERTMPGALIRSLYDGAEVKDLLLRSNGFAANVDFPDLIFLDLNMSKIGGRETTYLLKKDVTMKHIPLIILTTSSDPAEKAELLRLGADGYYVKPTEPTILVSIVGQVRDLFLGR